MAAHTISQRRRWDRVVQCHLSEVLDWTFVIACSRCREPREVRIPADAVLDNAEDGYSAAQIVAEIYPSLPLEIVPREACGARSAIPPRPQVRGFSRRPR